MPGIKSRAKGNAYECKLAQQYRAIGFPDCVTARSESKRTDDSGIDLCFTPPFQVQAKCYKEFSVSKALETLKTMPQNDNMNVCHVKIAGTKRRSDASKSRLRQGTAVVLLEEDRYEIVNMLKGNSII